MAGTWMSIVHGFGGLRVNDDSVNLNPIIPDAWDKYSFKLYFRGTTLDVSVTKDIITIDLVDGEAVKVKVFDKEYVIDSTTTISI